MAAPKTSHLDQLDSLRGLAAFSVMLSHFLVIFPAVLNATGPHDLAQHRLFWLLLYTPLRIFVAGHEAVIFFFILSGFVLALPFLENRKVSYSTFVVKRIFRIYPPYLAALCLGLLGIAIYQLPWPTAFSLWVTRMGQPPLDWHLFWEHVGLLGSFPAVAFVPVLWSLVEEMRISLLFPLLMLLVLRGGWRICLTVGLGLGLCHMVIFHLTFKGILPPLGYHETLAYIWFFLLGALLAQHRQTLVARYQSLRRSVRWLLLAIAWLAYVPASWLPHLDPFAHAVIKSILAKDFVMDCITGMGVAIFIVSALSSRSITSLLRHPVPLFLGRISYSLYLVHSVCLLVLLNRLYGHLPLILILLLTVGLSILVAVAGYHWVELPSIRVGKKVIQTFSRKPAQAS